jgi:DNA-binding cell septation regulator SpoVG
LDYNKRAKEKNMSESLFTNMKITPLKDTSGRMKAHGVVTVAKVVEVRFTVLMGNNGIFASLPSRRGNKPDETGKYPWYPDVKITDDKQYQTFQDMVRKSYAKALGLAPNAGEENQDTGGTYEDHLPF